MGSTGVLFGADSSIRSLIRTGTPELWASAHLHLGPLPSHQEGEKGRAKLLREFPVYILQVSQMDGSVTRLIGTATAPSTQPSRRLDPLRIPATVRTPGASALIVCAGASARTAAPY